MSPGRWLESATLDDIVSRYCRGVAGPVRGFVGVWRAGCGSSLTASYAVLERPLAPAPESGWCVGGIATDRFAEGLSSHAQRSTRFVPHRIL